MVAADLPGRHPHPTTTLGAQFKPQPSSFAAAKVFFAPS